MILQLSKHQPHTTNKIKYVAGYTTNKGVLLDLDRTTLQEALDIAKYYMKRFSLEGYLLIESSDLNHQIVFNKRFRSYTDVLSIIFKFVWNYHYYQHQRMPSLTHWAILQACKGSCTLRVNAKGIKSHPKILMRIGRQDKIIKEYLAIYEMFNKDKRQNKK